MEIRKNQFNPQIGLSEIEISVIAKRQSAVRSFTPLRVIIFDLSNGSRIYTQNFNAPEGQLFSTTTPVKLALEVQVQTGKKIEIQVYQQELVTTTFSSELQWKGLDKKTILVGDTKVVTKENIPETPLEKAVDLAEIGLWAALFLAIGYGVDKVAGVFKSGN